MAKLKTKSVLSYFGSDSEVAAKLAALLNHCKHVTIPFCGGLSILPHLEARAIVANDLHHGVIHFYRVLSGTYGESCRDQLISRCKHTLSHPAEIERSQHIATTGNGSVVGRAWAMWALCWIGRKGKGGTKHQGGMPSVRRTAEGGTNASRIRAAANDLDLWARDLERCEWEVMDFRTLLPKIADNADCGVYCDPPWFGAGRNYLHAFTEGDHIDLEFRLRRFQNATVLVRYGDCDEVRRLYAASTWHIIESESRDQHNAVKGEVWITNRLLDTTVPKE